MPYRSGLKAIQNPSGKSRGRCDCRHLSPDKKLTHTLHSVARRGFLLVIWMHTQMGDCRPLKTPPMGDVVKSNISDGVFIK